MSFRRLNARLVGLVSLALVVLGVPPARLPQASAQATPDPTQLPVATTTQIPLTAQYNARNVPSLAAGSYYFDPTTSVKIYKLTSATFPSSSANWRHDYSEGGDEVSLPYNGTTRAVLVRQNAGGPWWLIDFTPGVGVSNPRQLTGNLSPWIDLAFTFSNNPASPYYAYVSNGSAVRRFDIRTMTEAPGNGWPVSDASAMWLHQSENDGLFVWMRGATGDTAVGYEPSTGVKKTYTNTNMNEPRIDRAGRYIGLSMDIPQNGLVVWDWNTNTVVWSTTGTIPFAHNASLRRRWLSVDWNQWDASHPPFEFSMFIPDVPNSAQRIGGPANGGLIHGNGNWIQNPADLEDQWALFLHYGSLRPSEQYAWLAPGGMVLITANGQRRLLGHPYNTTGTYAFLSFAKFSSDGRYVLFTSNMNGSGRSDVFLAELPQARAGFGLVGWWAFDEGTGAIATDSSGNGNTGTLVNGPTWTTGKINDALEFNGLASYATVPHASALNAYPLTVAAWMKTNSTTGVRGIVNKYVANSNNGYQMFLNNGNLCAWYLRDASNKVYDGTGCTFNLPGYNDNQWHHVAYVVDASGGKLYVDGVQRGSLPWTGAAGAPTTAQEVHIAHYPGAFGGAEYFPGVIDDVSIYDRALSAAEVSTLYSAAP